MEMRFFFLLLLTTSTTSSLASSQSSDSCSFQLTAGDLIPFNTSYLTCVSAWSTEGFFLRRPLMAIQQYSKAGPRLWSFVLSAPDAGAYVAVGFSPDGRMVGSSAVAGWTAPGGGGVARQYSLGGYSSAECPPDRGSLPVVEGSLAVASRSSRLYLAFQLAATAPRRSLVYAVGPPNTSPAESSGGYLPMHRSMASGSLASAPAEDGGEGEAPASGVGDGREGDGDGQSSSGGYKTAAIGSGGEQYSLVILFLAVLSL